MNEKGFAPIWFLVGLFVICAVFFATCDAVFDDEDEENDLGWVPSTEESEKPPGCGPGRQDEPGGCDDKGLVQLPLDNNDGGNEHRDCENNTGECSDDDQVVISPVFCVQPESCRFG